jgi:hypothetical protein
MAAYRTRDARGVSSTNDCRDPAIGAIDPWAQDLVDRVGLYTEVTVRGSRPCANVALKTGAEIAVIQAGIILRTANILKSNRAVVLQIAQKLSWRKTLREREIAALLAGVAEAAP